MVNLNYCHFCGRSDSLHAIPDTNAKVCSKCWEIVAHIVTKLLEHSELITRLKTATFNNYIAAQKIVDDSLKEHREADYAEMEKNLFPELTEKEDLTFTEVYGRLEGTVDGDPDNEGE